MLKLLNKLSDNTVGSLWAKLNLTEREFGVLVGTILGDAYIDGFEKDARISILHSIKQKELVEWKIKELRRFVKQEITKSKHYDSRTNKEYISVRFQTKRFPEFKKLRDIFYKGKRKVVPDNIQELLVNPISLAVWYMDDGGRRKDCHGMFLNTLSFSRKEQAVLQDCLSKNFGINSRIHWISDGYRLYIPMADARKFCRIIGSYIIPSMIYKLPYDPVTTESVGIFYR